MTQASHRRSVHGASSDGAATPLPGSSPAKNETVAASAGSRTHTLTGSWQRIFTDPWTYSSAAFAPGLEVRAVTGVDAFYVVARLSSVARYVVVGLGGLGGGGTSIASLGQLALAVQVQNGIMKGELDPTAQRIDPYGGRKASELEKMLGLMLGDKEAGNKNDPK